MRQKSSKKAISIGKNVEETTTAEPKVTNRMKSCIFLGILSFLVYANTLKNGYTLDDDLFISNNRLVSKGIAGIPELLTTPHMEGVAIVANDTYRPLSLVMFAIENVLFGSSPMLGHFINILLFAGCAIMLFLFLDNLMAKKRTVVAFVASIFFAVHPIHTEVVANIKSRDELLCFLLAFGSVNAFGTYFVKGNKKMLLWGSLALFFSLLSKESSISFIIVIPLIFFFYHTGNKKRSINITAASIIVITAFLSLRVAVLHEILPTSKVGSMRFIDNQLVNVPTEASQMATAILGCGYYIKLLFIPYPLLYSYSFSTIPFASFENAGVLLSLATYIFLTFMALYRLIEFKKDLLAFAMFFYLITIALFTNIIFLIPGFVAERFLFFASAGFCLFMSLFFEKYFFTKEQTGSTTITYFFKNTKGSLLLILIVIIFSSMTVSRNSDWENDYILFKTDVEKAPGNARMYCDLAVVLNKNLQNEGLRYNVKSKMIDRGIDYAKQAIAINPRYSEAHVELAQFYVGKKLFDSAELHVQTAILLDSMNLHAIDIMAAVYFNTNKFLEALNLYKKVLQTDAGFVAEYRNIGLCYFNMQKFDSAISYFRWGLAAMPEYSTSFYEPIAISFKEMGKLDSAKKYEQLMIQ